jgi:hypothetical protein
LPRKSSVHPTTASPGPSERSPHRSTSTEARTRMQRGGDQKAPASLARSSPTSAPQRNASLSCDCSPTDPAAPGSNGDAEPDDVEIPPQPGTEYRWIHFAGFRPDRTVHAQDVPAKTGHAQVHGVLPPRLCMWPHTRASARRKMRLPKTVPGRSGGEHLAAGDLFCRIMLMVRRSRDTVLLQAMHVPLQAFLRAPSPYPGGGTGRVDALWRTHISR